MTWTEAHALQQAPAEAGTFAVLQEPGGYGVGGAQGSEA